MRGAEKETGKYFCRLYYRQTELQQISGIFRFGTGSARITGVEEVGEGKVEKAAGVERIAVQVDKGQQNQPVGQIHLQASLTRVAKMQT